MSRSQGIDGGEIEGRGTIDQHIIVAIAQLCQGGLWRIVCVAFSADFDSGWGELYRWLWHHVGAGIGGALSAISLHRAEYAHAQPLRLQRGDLLSPVCLGCAVGSGDGDQHDHDTETGEEEIGGLSNWGIG